MICSTHFAIGIIKTCCKPSPVSKSPGFSRNIFIDQADVAKLGDLGIAKRRGEEGVTERGYAPGTILYMSPEQVTGMELGPTTDIFAMGLVLAGLLAWNFRKRGYRT